MQGWQKISQQAAQGHLEPVHDRRFAAAAWSASPAHLLMAHMYLLSAHAMQKMVDASDAKPELKDRLHFSVMQWIDAMSPANFFATNPDAQRALVESGGETLRAGISNFLGDLQKGRITQTDETKFRVGENLAVTPGSVVYQNRYLQIIQYKPTTATVYQRPILLVPPCINKFYILDLQPENSFVRNAVAEGFTVFLVSWRNPVPEDTDEIDKATWDDYIEGGVLDAIKVVSTISGQKKINVLGFCVGGTMLATALAVAAGRGEHPEAFLGDSVLMTARELGATFSFLRPNELVWNYVVSNYLKGETPVPFDLLYWNGDSTNLPGPFFTWYFRNMYLENSLRVPKKLVCCGVPVDLRKVNAPSFVYSSREDHIVPWKSGYASTQIFSGPCKFVLGASGHIAGVINPPAKKKRSYWILEGENMPADAETWFHQATEHPGSWWPEWTTWLASHSGRRVKAPASEGSARYPVLEPAPGSFVKVRAV